MDAPRPRDWLSIVLRSTLVAAGVVIGGVVVTVMAVVLHSELGPPHLEMRSSDMAIELWPVFLGEYYLGIEEVEVRDAAGDRVLADARTEHGQSVRSFGLALHADAMEPLRRAGWTILAPTDGRFIPLQGETYRLRIRANNGSGHATWATRTVNLPGGAT